MIIEDFRKYQILCFNKEQILYTLEVLKELYTIENNFDEIKFYFDYCKDKIKNQPHYIYFDNKQNKFIVDFINDYNNLIDYYTFINKISKQYFCVNDNKLLKIICDKQHLNSSNADVLVPGYLNFKSNLLDEIKKEISLTFDFFEEIEYNKCNINQYFSNIINIELPIKKIFLLSDINNNIYETIKNEILINIINKIANEIMGRFHERMIKEDKKIQIVNLPFKFFKLFLINRKHFYYFINSNNQLSDIQFDIDKKSNKKFYFLNKKTDLDDKELECMQEWSKNIYCIPKKLFEKSKNILDVLDFNFCDSFNGENINIIFKGLIGFRFNDLCRKKPRYYLIQPKHFYIQSTHESHPMKYIENILYKHIN